MLSIKENLEKISKLISDSSAFCKRPPEDVLLIAVSKKKSSDAILEAIAAGARHFGENYIQEAIAKIDGIGKEKACWHFIGHLQSNKSGLAVRYFDYIHTVDSFKLAKEINRQAASINKIQKVLIQINISHEKTKSGVDPEKIIELITQIDTLDNLSVQGLMCMPPYFDDPEEARPFFKKLNNIQNNINNLKLSNTCLKHLSMGMSNDFKVAIEEGSTMVRIGTSIFGERN